MYSTQFKKILFCWANLVFFSCSPSYAAVTVINTHTNISGTDTTYQINAGDTRSYQSINYSGSGGALNINNANMTFNIVSGGALEFINNTVTGNGGALVFGGSDKTLMLSNALFENNISNAALSNFAGGGAIYTPGGTIITHITDTTFNNNRTTSHGGAINSGTIGNTVNLTDTVFINNHADGYGGAISGYGNFNIRATKNLTYSNNTSALGSNFAHIFSTGQISFDVDAGATLTIDDGFSQDASSSGTISKTGAGTLRLNGDSNLAAQPYKSRFTIYEGTVILGHDKALGNGSFNGNLLYFEGNGRIINDTGAPLTFTQRVVLEGVNTQAIFDGDQDMILNALSGTGSLIKTGTHTLILRGPSVNNSYSGLTTIEQGTLQIGDGAASGALGNTNDILNNATLAINRSGALSLNNNISGSGNLNVMGGAILSLNGTNTYSGGTNISNGSTVIGSTIGIQGNITNDGTLIFNQSDNGIYNGTLRGSGTLEKNNTGALNVHGNVSTQLLNVTGGQLNISAGRKITVAGNANFSTGTLLGVDISSSPALQADTVNFSGNNTVDIQGYSSNDSNSYTLIQTTNGILGDFAVTVGGNPLSSLVSLDTYIVGSADLSGSGKDLILSPILVWNNPQPASAHGTFNIHGNHTFTLDVPLENKTGAALGFGWGGKTLTKTGEGTLSLNAVNTYTGNTNVDQGTLIIGDSMTHNNASIAGNVNVQANATLKGHGQILGNVYLSSNATIAPGNSIGTITVQNIHFTPNSVYEFEANEAGQADRIIATGKATIQGGVVQVLAYGNIWKTTEQYTILSAQSGVEGTFDYLTSNLAFLNAELDYDPNNVYLRFKRNDVRFPEIGETENQVNVGFGLESLSPNQLIREVITSMDKYSALRAYDNLSGEIYPTTQAVLLSGSSRIRATIYQHLTSNQEQLEPHRNLWVNTWAHEGKLKGNSNTESSHIKGAGLAIGYDMPIAAAATYAGAAVAYESYDIKIAGTRHSKNDIDAYHLLAYGGTRIGMIDIRGGLDYAYLSMNSKRHITVSSLEGVNRADYGGRQIQAFIEGSHTWPIHTIDLTPYVNVAYTHQKMNDFHESGSYTALSARSSKTDMRTLTIGSRGRMALGAQGQHMLFADIGWKKHFGVGHISTDLNFIGGRSFTIKVNDISKSRAIIGLGGRIQIRPDIAIDMSYQGEYGTKIRNNTLQLTLNWRF